MKNPSNGGIIEQRTRPQKNFVTFDINIAIWKNSKNWRRREKRTRKIWEIRDIERYIEYFN